MNEQLYANNDIFTQITALFTLCDRHTQQLGVDLTLPSHSLLKLLACQEWPPLYLRETIHSPEHLHPASHPQSPVSV